MEKERDTDRIADMEIADIIMEMPHNFRVGQRRFSLRPVSLGKSHYLSRLTGALGIDRKLLHLNPYAEALRLCVENPDGVCRVIAAHTLDTPQELFDPELNDDISGYLRTNLAKEEMAELFALSLAEPDMAAITKRLGIDDDQKRRNKVMAAKKEDRNTYTFGGRSTFGALIAPACEKLHMTPRQVVWDISLRFLQLLLADGITQVYLTDEERKHCRISNDTERINADDPANRDIIKSMKWD